MHSTIVQLHSTRVDTYLFLRFASKHTRGRQDLWVVNENLFWMIFHSINVDKSNRRRILIAKIEKRVRDVVSFYGADKIFILLYGVSHLPSKPVRHMWIVSPKYSQTAGRSFHLDVSVYSWRLLIGVDFLCLNC